MTKKNIKIKIEVSGEINRLFEQGIQEQWTSSEFFKKVYVPIFIERNYTKNLESYLKGWYDAGIYIIWHTMMNPITMYDKVTWKSTGKTFFEAAE